MAEKTFGNMLGGKLKYEPQNVYQEPYSMAGRQQGKDTFQTMMDQEREEMDAATKSASDALGQFQTKKQENATTFLEEPWRGPHDEDY